MAVFLISRNENEPASQALKLLFFQGSLTCSETQVNTLTEARGRMLKL